MKDITQMPKKFYITYFAKKHKKIIPRTASAEKNGKGVLGKILTDKNGNDRFIYWDFDAENKTGGLGDWRQAVGQWTIKAIEIA